MRKPYYSQSVRMGIRSIVARIVPTTVDEIAAISYLVERDEKHAATLRKNSHGRGKAGAYSPVSAPAAPAASGEPEAAVSDRRGAR